MLKPIQTDFHTSVNIEVLAFMIKKIGPEINSLIKPITLMNCMYCLQTMSFQPKNEIKHPHP